MSDKSVTTTPSSAKGDDRNLVPVEAAAAIPLEDQIFLLWKQNRNLVIGAIVALIVVIAGWEVMQGMKARREEGIRTAYGAAETIEAKRAFARENAGHQLAGLALLAVADDSFSQQRFEDAAREYAAAAGTLQEPLFLGRARIGEGVAALRAGQPAKGEQVLLALTSDTTAMMAFRCQAFYELAQFAEAEGNATKAIEMIDRLKGLDPTGQWAGVAAPMRARLGNSIDPLAMPAQTP